MVFFYSLYCNKRLIFIKNLPFDKQFFTGTCAFHLLIATTTIRTVFTGILLSPHHHIHEFPTLRLRSSPHRSYPSTGAQPVSNQLNYSSRKTHRARPPPRSAGAKFTIGAASPQPPAARPDAAHKGSAERQTPAARRFRSERTRGKWSSAGGLARLQALLGLLVNVSHGPRAPPPPAAGSILALPFLAPSAPTAPPPPGSAPSSSAAAGICILAVHFGVRARTPWRGLRRFLGGSERDAGVVELFGRLGPFLGD